MRSPRTEPRPRLGWIAALACAALLAAGPRAHSAADAEPELLDLVLANGRVLDPESGLDATLHIGIRDGRIALLSPQPLEARESVDVSGLAVAPGFIDLHVHGHNPLSYDFLARDGVTAALDLEIGAHGVKGFLRSREGEARIHYGVAAGHVPTRVKVVDGVSGGHPPTRSGGMQSFLQRFWRPTGYVHEPLDAKGVRTLVRILGEQMDEGGIGVGMGLAYTPGATPDEVRAVFALAADRGATVFLHLADQQRPDDLAPLEQALAHARATGASLHVVHIVSSTRAALTRALAAIDAARDQGLLVTTEVYPYTAGSTLIESAIFEPGWRERLGIDYGDLQWVATGERLTAESFERYRKQGGTLVMHGLREEWVEQALRHPGVLVASDGMPFYEGGEHPRLAGTHARVLGRYVRERHTLELMDALARMSWLPARRLEWQAPALAHKGRIKLGADADLVVFDPATVIDRATYEDSHQASAGIPHVLVAGRFVVRDGALVTGAFPGQPLRSRARGAR
jgi:dihydroorotase